MSVCVSVLSFQYFSIKQNYLFRAKQSLINLFCSERLYNKLSRQNPPGRWKSSFGSIQTSPIHDYIYYIKLFIFNLSKLTLNSLPIGSKCNEIEFSILEQPDLWLNTVLLGFITLHLSGKMEIPVNWSFLVSGSIRALYKWASAEHRI